MVARAVGAVEKGEQLLREMDTTLAALAAGAPARPITIAGWDAAGGVPGKGTLFDSILTAAGGVNIAATWSGPVLGAFDIEELLATRPDLLAFGDSNVGKPTLRSETLRHPAIRRAYANRTIVYPSSYYSCGIPESARAAQLLRDEMLRRAPMGGGE
jgi:iron complex transport system substrate-binding protein